MLGNYIESVSRPGARQVRVKCVKDTGHEVFNILSQCLKYSSYTKGTGWGDFTMWFGGAENARQAVEAVNGWLSEYARKVDSGDFGPAANPDAAASGKGSGEGSGEGTDASAYTTYIIIGAAVLLIVLLLKRKKK